MWAWKRSKWQKSRHWVNPNKSWYDSNCDSQTLNKDINDFLKKPVDIWNYINNCVERISEDEGQSWIQRDLISEYTIFDNLPNLETTLNFSTGLSCILKDRGKFRFMSKIPNNPKTKLIIKYRNWTFEEIL